MLIMKIKKLFIFIIIIFFLFFIEKNTYSSTELVSALNYNAQKHLLEGKKINSSDEYKILADTEYNAIVVESESRKSSKTVNARLELEKARQYGIEGKEVKHAQIGFNGKGTKKVNFSKNLINKIKSWFKNDSIQISDSLENRNLASTTIRIINVVKNSVISGYKSVYNKNTYIRLNKEVAGILKHMQEDAISYTTDKLLWLAVPWGNIEAIAVNLLLLSPMSMPMIKDMFPITSIPLYIYEASQSIKHGKAVPLTMLRHFNPDMLKLGRAQRDTLINDFKNIISKDIEKRTHAEWTAIKSGLILGSLMYISSASFANHSSRMFSPLKMALASDIIRAKNLRSIPYKIPVITTEGKLIKINADIIAAAKNVTPTLINKAKNVITSLLTKINKTKAIRSGEFKSINLNKIKIKKKIGTGQGGKINIYQAKYKGKPYVLPIYEIYDHKTRMFDINEAFLKESEQNKNLIFNRINNMQSMKNIYFENQLIVPEVHGVVKNKDGIVVGYLEEYIKGKTLMELNQKGALTEPQLTEILRQLQGQLNELHKRGYVHGDTHTGNILVEFTALGPRARFIDFSPLKYLKTSEERIAHETFLFNELVVKESKKQLARKKMLKNIQGGNKTIRNLKRSAMYKFEQIKIELKSRPKEIASYLKYRLFLEKFRYKSWIKDKKWIEQQIRDGKILTKSKTKIRSFTKEETERIMKGDISFLTKEEIKQLTAPEQKSLEPESFKKVYNERMNQHKNLKNYNNNQRQILRQLYLNSLEK